MARNLLRDNKAKMGAGERVRVDGFSFWRDFIFPVHNEKAEVLLTQTSLAGPEADARWASGKHTHVE